MFDRKKMNRRDFMAAAGGALVQIGLPGVFVKLMDMENKALAETRRPDGLPRIPPGQHAVKALPNMGGTPAPDDATPPQLTIAGNVAKPQSLTIQNLMKLEQIDLTCDVHCVTGWTLLESRWQGVTLQTIIELVQPSETAGFVIFEAPGGYTSSIPLGEAKKDNVILAHSFSGRKLPEAHGAPIRSLVPDRYFYKSVKWLQRVRFEAVDEPGYYESSGYSNSADPWKEERYD